MELKYYLSVLWRRKWVILVAVMVTTLITAIGSSMMTPQYAATATLWVPASEGSGVGSGDILLNDRLINTYAELATSRPVLTELERTLNVAANDVRNSVKTSHVAQTELLRLTVRDPNPQLAADIATNLARIVVAQTQQTEAGRSLRVSLFAPAGVPTNPTWLGLFPTPYWREINVVLGFVLSLFAGLSLAFLFEYLDTTLYTTEQIESVSRLAVLGEIPAVKLPHPTITANGRSPYGEAFRYLRTSLFAKPDVSVKALLFTSALPEEGKSTIVANLSFAIAQSKHRVIVVDANLHQPCLHKVFNLSNETGLSSLLKEEVTLTEALQDSDVPSVQVITSGPLPSNPAELLDSTQIRSLIEQLKQQTDVILIDTPAILTATDTAVLSSFVDGVILVVERAQTHQEAVATARHQLAAIDAKLIGLVVNRAKQVIDYRQR